MLKEMRKVKSRWVLTKECPMKRFMLLVIITLALPPAVLTQNGRAQSAGQQPQFNLNGIWLDNGRIVHIMQIDNGVEAKYEDEYVCNPGGDITPMSTYHNFLAKLEGNQLVGTTTTCDMCQVAVRTYGPSASPSELNAPSPAQLHNSKMKLTVSANGKTLEGLYYDHYENSWEPFKLTRVNVCLMRKGFIYVTPTLLPRNAVLRDRPSAAPPAKIIGTLPNGARLLYTDLTQENGKVTWLYVQPPGGTPGWLSAEDASLVRPPSPLPLRPTHVPSNDTTPQTTTSTGCAAGRG
jgi:hypothetical protein